MTSTSIRAYKNIWPTLADSVFIDPTATVIGKVTIAEESSVWPMVVIRGDVNEIHIGARSNIQDASVIHVSRPKPSNPEGYPSIIGDDVTIGHKVMLHGCRIGNRVLIGMGAIVLDGVVIEDEVIVGAGALVTPGKHLESGFLYVGSPARKARPLKDSERAYFVDTAHNYIELKNDFLNEK
jgi:carbonic anhydrase/acetyltransferase-like protein (isoleucine patch superfamily)